MADAIFLVISAAFFAVCVLYVRGLDRMAGDAVEEPDAERVEAYRDENGLPADAEVPVDAVTASSSGLDAHISVANARLQAPRVAESRAVDVGFVLEVVDEHTDGRAWGFLGEPGVNVWS
jgi:K+-transporting ATPase KdpC subunit